MMPVILIFFHCHLVKGYSIFCISSERSVHLYWVWLMLIVQFEIHWLFCTETVENIVEA